MGSELFALKEICDAVRRRFPHHNMRVSPFGACDRRPCCLQFLQKNHEPKHLTGDMLAREVIGNGEDARDQCLFHQKHCCISQKTPRQCQSQASEVALTCGSCCSKVHTTTLAGKQLLLPKDQLDMYVLGFPCTPWSLRGEGAGFNDPNCKPFWAGLSTIKHCRPKTFVMENARGQISCRSYLGTKQHACAGPRSGGGQPVCKSLLHLIAGRQVESMNIRKTTGRATSMTDLDTVLQTVREELQSMYLVLCLRNLQPTLVGYPMVRPRFYIIGIKRPFDLPEDAGCRAVDALLRGVQDPVRLTYPVFLKMQSVGFSWERVGSLPDSRELDKLKRCGCSLNPFSICEVHPCKCQSCKAQGSGDSTVPIKGMVAPLRGSTAPEQLPAPPCSWRRKAAEYIKKHMPNVTLANEEGKLTYVEVMEMMGLEGPTSARERNLLNLVALHPKAVPLDTSLAILDLSQGIDRLTIMANGIIPTLATNSRPWSMRHARVLTVGELMAACGLPPAADMREQTESSARFMLGNCMHVADIGIAVSAALFLALGLFP